MDRLRVIRAPKNKKSERLSDDCRACHMTTRTQAIAKKKKPAGLRRAFFMLDVSKAFPDHPMR